MGLFSKKVNEKRYLDNVIRSMYETKKLLSPHSMYGDREKDTGLIASTLASLVSLVMIARYIAAAHPTPGARARFAQTEWILEDAHKDAWALVDMFGLNMNDVVAIGQEESAKYLEWVGGDGTLWHERGHEGHKEFRREAVLFLHPVAEQVAEDRMFWGIVNQSDD